MSRAPLLTLVVAAAVFAALPVSIHFEGNDATAEPFLYVLPIAIIAAGGGVAISLRRSPALAALNSLAAVVIFAYWVWLVTYPGA